jgi:chromosome segregation ATPase
MDDVYETNAPREFPNPQAQPEIDEKKAVKREAMKISELKETVERWKKDIVDRIQFLKENYDQALQDKEALTLEVDKWKAELAASDFRVQELERQLADVLETYNNLIKEVSGALQN